MTKLLVVTLLTLLGGCASLSGNAMYTYQKTGPDLCTLKVDTGRVLAAGVSVQLEDCNVKVEAPSVEQGGSSAGDVISILQAAAALQTPKEK